MKSSKIEVDDMTVENFLKDVKKMRLVFSQLTPIQEKVLKYRWGFYIYPTTHTLEETGKKCGVSRERIRQIEAQIIAKTNSAIELMKES